MTELGRLPGACGYSVNVNWAQNKSYTRQWSIPIPAAGFPASSRSARGTGLERPVSSTSGGIARRLKPRVGLRALLGRFRGNQKKATHFRGLVPPFTCRSAEMKEANTQSAVPAFHVAFAVHQWLCITGRVRRHENWPVYIYRMLLVEDRVICNSLTPLGRHACEQQARSLILVEIDWEDNPATSKPPTQTTKQTKQGEADGSFKGTSRLTLKLGCSSQLQSPHLETEKQTTTEENNTTNQATNLPANQPTNQPTDQANQQTNKQPHRQQTTNQPNKEN